MTKQELIDELKTKFYKVGTEAQQQEQNGIKWYTIQVHDKGTNTIVEQTVSFYVEDEGGAGEAAFYGSKEPKPAAPAKTFTQDVQDFINTKIADSTLEYATITSINETAKKALVSAVYPDKTRPDIIIRDNAGTLEILNLT